MALMTWNEHFVTGVAIIDEQHQWLIELINKSAPVMLDYQHNQEQVEALLDQLVNYAVFHFQTEDRLMQQSCIDPRHHKLHLASHTKFADDVGRMRAAVCHGDLESVGTLLSFLANWLVFHILDEDMALARQMKAIESGVSSVEAFEMTEGKHRDPAHEAQSRALIDLYALMTEQNHKLMENNYELANHRVHLEALVSARTADLLKALDAAEASNRARNSFIANMSHEIRTPMNAIVGITWALEQNTHDPAQLVRLQQVGDATQRLLGIINDLLDMARLESERLTLEPLDFDPAKVLHGVVAGIRESTGAKGLALELSAPDLPALLRGDPIRLGQILGNFTSNAAKFTERGSIVVRACQLAGGNGRIQFRFEVEDTGPGIDAEQLPRLFEPFEQLDASSTRRHGGAGLGLAISRRLAEMMEGRVGAESTPGKGSIFWLEVPLELVLQTAEQSLGSSPEQDAGSATLPSSPQVIARNRETLERLAQLLAEDDVMAVTLWNESSTSLRAAFDGRTAPFEAALAAYDFAAAHTLLQQILTELQVPRVPQ